MVFDLSKVSGLGDYQARPEKGPEQDRTLYFRGEHAFLVVNPHTIEVRTDAKLAALLQEKYESVMQSRYFGRGGNEIVLAGQLSPAELDDLVRLSYNLTD